MSVCVGVKFFCLSRGISFQPLAVSKRNGIENDPNRADDETHIVNLIGKVISVSLETVEIVKNLSGLDIGAEV